MFYRPFVAALACSFVVACGGGGGGTAAAPASPVASTETFQLRAAQANSSAAGTYPFKISGGSSSVAITGSGTITIGAPTQGTFQGSFAYLVTGTVTGSVSGNGQSTTIASSGITYLDSNYLPLAYSGSEFSVNGPYNYPATVKVNDSGVLGTSNRYSDSSMANFIGTETDSYSVQPDTATTALVVLTAVYKDANGAVTSTQTSKVRITPSGGFTRINISTVYPNGSTVVFTF